MNDEALEKLVSDLEERASDDETEELIRDLRSRLASPKALDLRPAISAIKRLGPEPGDVLAVMVPPPVTRGEGQAMMAALKTRVTGNVWVMILPDRMEAGEVGSRPDEMMDAIRDELKQIEQEEDRPDESDADRRHRVAGRLAEVAMAALLEELAASGERVPVDEGGGG